MNDAEATPMIAARTRISGPRGQAKGASTIDDKKVDAICREVYGAIYKGNTKDPTKTTDKYQRQVH